MQEGMITMVLDWLKTLLYSDNIFSIIKNTAITVSALYTLLKVSPKVWHRVKGIFHAALIIHKIELASGAIMLRISNTSSTATAKDVHLYFDDREMGDISDCSRCWEDLPDFPPKHLEVCELGKSEIKNIDRVYLAWSDKLGKHKLPEGIQLEAIPEY